ncbi:MFS transporter [Herbidospora sp. NBRC 101105]|uniref:MFS transporter n=1 Tax=Herbidospora sp. NBRC 101105 TaxID=3032195 RepID=UPI0024A0760C|nr:MFS transporter [Herbidospora sp. NBRC 101105]GLX92061.1 MFS transporter [Herbidospora sp. NBRC 101105]
MSAPASAPSGVVEDAPLDRTAITVIVLACLGQFMVVLDVSIVNVALPAMRAELGFTETGLQWVVNAYALTFAGLMLLGGRAADLFGRKRVFLTGVSVFALASLLGGLAADPGLLIAARVLQGVGAAVLAPTTLTILTTTFSEGPRRTAAISAWNAVGAAGGAAGGILGGTLTELLSWRWTLLINVPIGLAIVVTGLRVIARDRPEGSARLDLPGAALVTAALTAIAYGTVETHEHGWGSPVALVPLVLGVLGLGVFVLVEKRTASPLVPLSLLARRTVAGTTIIQVLSGAIFFAMWYFLSIHMQGDLGYTPMTAGLAFLPHALTLIATGRLAPLLLRRMTPRTLLIGATVVGIAGMLLQSAVLDGYVLGILVPGVLMCAGAGMAFTPLVVLATNGVQRSESGLVSGILGASRQVGGSLGLAALATVAATMATPEAGYGAVFLIGAVLMAVSIVVALVVLPSRAATRRADQAAASS